MRATRKDQRNYAVPGAIVFSLFCWLGLFAVWGNFGESGFELLRAPGIVSAVEGAVLIALNAFGLLVLAAFAIAGVGALVRIAHDDARHTRGISGKPR
jgi:hypothetical protein